MIETTMVKIQTLTHSIRALLSASVETTGFHGAGHAVETMDVMSQALSLLEKIYLDEIDEVGNYESTFP